MEANIHIAAGNARGQIRFQDQVKIPTRYLSGNPENEKRVATIRGNPLNDPVNFFNASR